MPKATFIESATYRSGLLVFTLILRGKQFFVCVFVVFCFIVFLFVCLQRTEHALECRVTRMPHVKTWFKDQLASVMMDTKDLGQNALVSGSIICQIVKRHLTAHIAFVKDQLLKELCYTICFLFKQLELKAHQLKTYWIPKIAVHVCYLRLYLKTEAAFCRLLQGMTGMEMDWNLVYVDFSPNSTWGDEIKKPIQVTGTEQLLDEFYVTSGIIKVQISVTRRCWRSRLITLDEK